MHAQTETDRSLRRVQRDAAIICGLMAASALIAQGGRTDGALGVLAGAGLMALSYVAIKGSADAVVQRTSARAADGEAGGRMSGVVWPTIKFIGRYGLLALGAWLVLVPLHANPLGVFAGVSALVFAIAIESVRLYRTRF
ncbi:MAG: hypothetical protein AABY89_09815 [Acidobacteriota bacterium]